MSPIDEPKASPDVDIAPDDTVATQGEHGAAPPTKPKPGSPFSKLAEGARMVLVPLLVAAGIGFFGWYVNKYYPIKHWLFWRYAGYWLLCAFFAVASISAGHATIHKVLRRSLPLLEHVSAAFAIGVFEVFLAMNVLGHLQLFKGWVFFALPLGLLAASVRSSYPFARRALRHLRWARRTSLRVAKPWWWWPVVLYGLFGCFLVYFAIMTPDNVQFDSRWKHLALAEEFSVYGGLRRFPEGWTVATYPHLPSFLYGWAFLLPGVRLFDRVELACHLEFFLFLATIASIPAVVRLLVPRSRAHLSWVARFLFPGVFLYDSSLSAGADHIGAFFALPAFALLIRFYRDLEWRYAFLMAFPLAGVALSKYTATTMVVPIFALTVGVRAAWGLLSYLRKKGAPALRANFLRGPAVALGAILALTAVHWVKNWIWYGDPAYPALYKTLPLRPWTEDSADMFEWGYKDFQFWRPTRDWDGVVKTLEALFTFSFWPNDYPRYHGKVPTFGSVFTLLLVVLPFLRNKSRIVALVVATHVSLFIWYWTHHQDRYLQVIVPWMTCATVAILLKLRERAPDARGFSLWSSRATRFLAGALCTLQAVWGADIWTYPTHAMAQSPHKRVIDMIAKGTHKKDYESRFAVFGPWSGVAKGLPPGARAVLHDNHVHLGINTSTINDWMGWQYGLSYVRIGSPSKMWATLKGEMGATHLVWENLRSVGWDTIGGDLVFFELAYNHTDKKRVNGVWVGTLGEQPPSDEGRNDQVAFLACDRWTYKNGLYKVTDLTTPVFGPKSKSYPKPRVTNSDEDSLLAQAAFAVVDPSCAKQRGLSTLKEFQLVAHRKRTRPPRGKKTFDLYLRKGDAKVTVAPEQGPADASDDEMVPGEKPDGDLPADEP